MMELANTTGDGEIRASGSVGSTLCANSAPDHSLRIAIVVETFAKDMGYVTNTLPKYLVRLGQRVDLITSEKLPYFQKGSGTTLFGSEFAQRNANRVGTQEIEGFRVHTLPSVDRFGYTRLQGLGEKLTELAPEIVCIFVAAGWIALDCALGARRLGYRLVIGNHTGKTHFPLANVESHWWSPARLKCLLLRGLPGRFIGAMAHHCVVPTTDCAEVVTRFFGVDRRKVRVMNLPVDNDFFHPCASDADRAERAQTRVSLGIGDDETVCVYSGKFTHAKNPVVLARALDILAAEGQHVRALFIGAGEQAALLGVNLRDRVISFIPFSSLGRYFRAADIGVWMDESISYLDAASSGLPLVLGSTVKDISHLLEFTVVFEADDPAALADRLRPLLDPAHRAGVARLAGQRAGERFSASGYAAQRLAYFHEALAA